MAQVSQKRRIHTESDMARAVIRHLNKGKVIVGSEVKVGRCRFDVVAYDKKKKIFKMIECKRHSRPTSIGRTFGQAVTYFALLEGRAFEFVDAASKKLPRMRYGEWCDATSNGKRIRVAVYVALTHKACMQPEFPTIRAQYPQIGVIRVKPDGRCRNALRRRGGKADSKGAEAVPQTTRL